MNRDLVIRIAKVISVSLNLRPIRTSVDNFGAMTHFVPAIRRSKLDFKFTGVFTRKLERTLTEAFPDFVNIVHEARVPLLLPSKIVTAPYLTGTLAKGVLYFTFSVDPIGTLTVRQPIRGLSEHQAETGPHIP